ncbi:hypothetical protein RND81_12G164000 [Saponaria officinalis]|uniref:IBH1-like N-terminal domain-containing protein n=1 Tax=Saponaria officinalis TaxID=3572 RepID=A0AAW1HBK5_SAPOF
MSSTMNSNYEEQSDISIELHRKKRRKIDGDVTSTSTDHRRRLLNADQFRWRTSAEQHTYSGKLIDALRHVRRRNAPAISGSRAVRDAADKALAIAARGRTRWSRAILSNRRRNNHRKAKISSKSRIPPPRTPSVTAAKVPPLEKRVKVLGRLVPGCRKLSFPNLLEETTDYIAALQMQVRAMAAIAELLSGSSSSASGSMAAEPASSRSNNTNNSHNNPVQ